MESDRTPAIRLPLSRVLTTTALVAFVLTNTPEAAVASAEKGHRGGDATSWADPNGYHVGAAHPGSPSTGSDGRQRQNGPSDSGSRGPSTPTYCKAAAIAVRIADPIAAMGGTPVTCDPGQGPAPTVTPQDLAQRAWNTLRLPLPDVHTAPPRGTEGLVGLPEWVWVPHGQWRPLTKRASAGPAWARVTATPKQLTIRPGAGIPTMSCGGPGTAYDPTARTSGQQTNCAYTYLRSSRNQPGGVDRMTVTVVWGGTWVGSGGTGGGLPDISRSTTFALRVAEGQGLYE
jgi:hypothetical protein